MNPTESSAPLRSAWKRVPALVEDGVVALLLLALLALPLASFLGRELLGSASALAGPLVQHANLLLCFAGASVAARDGKLLRLATAEFQQRLPLARFGVALAALVSALTVGLLARAAWELVLLERETGTSIGGALPLWPVLLVMPLGLAGIGLRLTWATAGRVARGVALAAFLAGIGLGTGALLDGPAWPWVTLLIVGAAYGAPLFVPLSGCALFLFLADGTPALSMPVAMLGLATSPFLPAIPLFTLTGFLLTEGAARRLLAVFRACFGWLPGGTAVVAVLLCTFFSIFTGGSGVTILALGGLLHSALSRDGYPDRFALGLVTGSGSLGILLPPALPLILFAIAAQVPVEDLFLAGILPGVLLVVLVCLSGVRAGLRSKVPRTPFVGSAAARAVWDARFELALPLVTLVLLFSGRATLLEAASWTAVYALVVQTLVQRELSLTRDLPRILRECGGVLGGVLIILTAAKGLSSYFVDAQVPARLLELVQSTVHSPWGFLLLLNLFLLVVGCFLDIYSATFVVVPLILGLARAYGIDPVHLGIVFIANLELGYLTPPVGLNLFLASYRFDRPLLVVARAVLPILLIQALGVVCITYLPWLTSVLR